jgi:hypothetical protein
MKNLKNVLFLASLLLLTFCKAQRIEVAKLNPAGQIEFTEDLKKVKEGFIKVLEQQKISATLTDYQILQDVSEGGVSYYHIVAKNGNESVKVAHKLALVSSSFIFDFAEGSTTCSGCTRGCNPKLDVDGYYFCTSCSEGSGCSKSTTVPTHYP